MLFIYLASVSDFDYQDNKFFVANFRKYPIISYSVTPLTGTVRCQAFTNSSRVFAIYKILFYPGYNYVLNVFIKFF